MIGHLYERRYEVVTYPSGDGWQEGWGGFAARILVNPSGSELRNESKLFAAYQVKERTAQDEDAYWQHVAPRIPEWNLVIRDADGNEQVIPPPADEWQSIYHLEPSVIAWLALTIHIAHIPKARARMQGIPEPSPSAPTTTDTTPPIPLHPESSSKPADSVSTA